MCIRASVVGYVFVEYWILFFWVHFMIEFAISWQRTWSDLGLRAPVDLLKSLINAYQEPQRHYHSLQHLSECLALFESVRQFSQYPGEVALALWFHDAVYDVKGKNNELKSAQWAVNVLCEVNAAQVVVDRVYALIIATKHDGLVAEPDQQLIVDIDLAILGSSPERFAQYDAQVRAEYRWVPGVLYKMKRKAVLNGFLQKQSIYSTDYFKEHYETQARINLLRALK